MAKVKTGVYFVDGIIGRRHIVGIPAYLNQFEHEDREFTRFYTYNHDSRAWKHTNWEHEIVSVAYTRVGTDWTWHLLSKRGVLVQLTATGSRELRIPDADTGPGQLGYVTQVRLIDGSLYVCGFRRQVYRLQGTSWVHIDQGLLAPPEEIAFGFQSIDGTAADDLYAVGFKGEMYHYNGRTWRQINIPTNVDLNRVRCVSKDLVYACGDVGVLVRGAGGAWDVIQDPGFTKDFWGVEVFEGTVYLASLGGLRFLDGTAFPPVETGLDPTPTGFRLHARDGLLWSFGQDDLIFFDGTKWERIVCPDNAVP